MARLLLISSDGTLIASMKETLESIKGLELEVVDDVNQACVSVAARDVVVVVYHLTEPSGVTRVPRLLQAMSTGSRSPGLLVVTEVYHAVQALALLRLGVVDCLHRPLDLNYLSYLIELLVVSARIECQPMGTSVAEDPSMAHDADLAGSNVDRGPAHPDTDRLLEQVKRIAPLDTTVLLEGETGTGKTRLGALIHAISPRSELPFVVVNCGALSVSLIESEIFGHVRGAFTGADADRTGKFAEAGRGTLFLDEIDSLSLTVQAKLLRAVEERVFEPVGSNRSRSLEARLIVASNRSLRDEVAAKRFRADLFYRLNVVAFEMPPLRQRVSAIPGLAQEFLLEFAVKTGRSVRGIAPEALQSLITHSWPGNIRELRNVMERAVAFSKEPTIGMRDLPVPLNQIPSAVAGESEGGADSYPRLVRPTPASSSLAESRAHVESGLIAEVLQRNGGNRLRAAAELGISRKTLYQKLSKYGLLGSAG
jgi:two-component system response regulator HydG